MSLYITKAYLKQYHDHIKNLPREATYPELIKYERDADGNVKLDAQKNPIIVDGGCTLIEAINNKLSKDDAEKWDASYHPFSKNVK